MADKRDTKAVELFTVADGAAQPEVTAVTRATLAVLRHRFDHFDLDVVGNARE